MAASASRYYIASIGETLGPNRDYQAEASIGAMAAYTREAPLGH